MQGVAYRLCLSGHNCLITGNCGSGKTHLLRNIAQTLKNNGKNVAVTATTGMAATQFSAFGATTLHRWCGISTAANTPRDTVEYIVNKRMEIVHTIQQTNVLLIDEIGMLSDSVLDLVDYVCKKIRNSDVSFGGLQVIAAGSFTQLPPVPNVRHGDLGKYCFTSKEFKTMFPHHVHLTDVVRQKEKELALMVEELCLGEAKENTHAVMKSLSRPITSKAQDVTVLLGTNFAVDMWNYNCLHEGGCEEIKNYVAIDTGNKRELSKYPAPRVLSLKTGVPVILLRNLSPSLVNGLRGTVITAEDVPVVDFNGTLWSVEKYVFKEANSTREQYPLKLAFALTVHRAQGQTLTEVIVDCADFFSPGQLGVAVGRATSTAGLQVLNYEPELGQIKHRQAVYEFMAEAQLTKCDSDLPSSSCCFREISSFTQSEGDGGTSKRDEDGTHVIGDDSETNKSRDDNGTNKSGKAIAGNANEPYEHHADVPVVMKPEYISALVNCKIQDDTNEKQREINKVIDGLLDSHTTPAFMAQIGEHSMKQLQSIEKICKKGNQSARSNSISAAYTEIHRFTTSAEFEEMCKSPFIPETITELQRKVCCMVYRRLFSEGLSKISETISVTEPCEKTQSSQGLPDDLPAKLKSKLRYIGGHCVAKLEYRYKKRIYHSLEKKCTAPVVSLQDKLKRELFVHLKTSDASINMDTADPESLQETNTRQGATKGLTHLKDVTYFFFMALYRKVYALKCVLNS